MWHVYVVEGRAYIPTVARTEAGFFLDVDPVAQAPLSDRTLLLKTFEETLARGTPTVPTPPPGAFPKPVVLVPMRLRSWSALMKKGDCVSVFPLKGGYEVIASKTDTKGRWSDDPDSKITLKEDRWIEKFVDYVLKRCSASYVG